MSTDTPRVRMFAGPNGSGKSTIKSVISQELLGAYVNADELEKEIHANHTLDLAPFGVHPRQDELTSFFEASSLLRRAGHTAAATIRLRGALLDFGELPVNSYVASVAADFIRRKLVESSASLTFETVMSSPDKIEFLREAQSLGYRTYLYYISTSDPSIKVSRVRDRVRMGGHPVPEEKIVTRYHRSLDLLASAIQVSNRAYIFDNSSTSRIWLAEITDGHRLEMRAPEMPEWFKRYVWDRMGSQETE